MSQRSYHGSKLDHMSLLRVRTKSQGTLWGNRVFLPPLEVDRQVWAVPPSAEPRVTRK